MTFERPQDPGEHPAGQHIATIGHEGRFWDVYLHFEDDPRRPDSYRGLFSFSPAGGESDDPPLRTIPVIIEPSWEEAMRKARTMEEHQLVAFLRSLLP